MIGNAPEARPWEAVKVVAKPPTDNAPCMLPLAGIGNCRIAYIFSKMNGLRALLSTQGSDQVSFWILLAEPPSSFTEPRSSFNVSVKSVMKSVSPLSKYRISWLCLYFRLFHHILERVDLDPHPGLSLFRVFEHASAFAHSLGLCCAGSI